MAAYTSPKRVERNGFLIAFKGETMTETEARKRGLLGANESAPASNPEGGNANTGNEGNALSKAEVKAELESRGIKYNSRTSEKKLRELLAEALAVEEAKDEKPNTEPPADGEGENPEAKGDADGEGEGENPEAEGDADGEGEDN